MREVTFDLSDGLQVGEKTYSIVVMRELTAGDLLDAKTDSEQLHLVPAGYDEAGRVIHEPQLVCSPIKMAVETLRRQVVALGPISGPLEYEMLRKLTTTDFNKLIQESEKLDTEASVEVAQQRGRSDRDSGDH